MGEDGRFARDTCEPAEYGGIVLPTNRSVVLMAGLVLTLLAGCNRGTPGGPGASGLPAQSPLHAQAEDTFNLGAPILATSIKQGETQQVSITITRGRNFDQDVRLDFGTLPAGITVQPTRPVIKHGDAEAKVMLKAANNASLGDFNLAITGHPATGPDAIVGFRIHVDNK